MAQKKKIIICPNNPNHRDGFVKSNDCKSRWSCPICGVCCTIKRIAVEPERQLSFFDKITKGEKVD